MPSSTSALDLVFPDDDDSVASESQDSSELRKMDDTQTNSVTEEEKAETLAQKETQAVKRLRCLAYSVLLAVAITASVGVYLYSTNEETQTFRNEFESHGTKVIASFQEDSYKKLQALASLSSELTRYALSKEMMWPFVTVDQSSYLLEPYLSLGDFAAIQVQPIVSAHLRDVWESYAVEQQGWIDQDLKARNVTAPASNLYSPRSKIAPYIKNYVGIDTSPGEWIPFWQYAPVIPNRFFVNFNRLAWKGFHQEANTCKNGKATLSRSWIFEPGLDLQSTQDFQFTDELLRAGGFKGNYDSEPLSYIHYPVLQNFQYESQTAAILSATVYWTSYFSNILPPGVEGIVCVISNNQGQQFTYEINGQEATFLGMQDLHNSKYNQMELAADYHNFHQEASSRYTGVPVDDQEMSYSIRVYPSVTFEATYTSHQPWLYALAMLFMFLFTASIIILYDWYVERRQKVVLQTAEKSTAVVASLFPKTVRDRVMEEAAPTASKKEDKKSVAFKNLGATMTTGDLTKQPLPKTASSSSSSSSSIIADFFPEATIMFTDIKGFTAWCSAREPAQVFALLETLYGSFDKIAKRRRIFKVETIGDCYVACAGCPTPRTDHAVAVVRFARDCLFKMNLIFKRLELSLGPGTGDLSMRFGIHSGPVTGGVVRGENARFQLFGDTMNVAARMESNVGTGHLQGLALDVKPAIRASLPVGKKGIWKTRIVEQPLYWSI